MLFIWDLHFKADKKDQIFNKLQEKISQINPENIIFLWDYIYHFAYNPKVIWEFFDFCLTLSEDKKVYILAWNHDYIKGHFIFQEAEKALKLANSNLKIISQPQVEVINNKKILFLPFFTNILTEQDFVETDKLIKGTKLPDKSILNQIFVKAYQNRKQDDKNLKISWSINLILLKNYIQHQPDLIVHHFYTENTVFPGQFAKFSFKNIALDEKIFELETEIISGHLHQPFKHKNYVCVGSFWNTSPLEENDTKIIFHYPDKFYQVVINPYISLEEEKFKTIDENVIKSTFSQATEEISKNLQSRIIPDNFDIKQFNLIIKTKNFKQAESKLAPALVNKISKIQYRQKTKKLWNILQQLEINQDQLAVSFSSWKNLAKEYIKKKYPENYQEYLEELEELGLS